MKLFLFTVTTLATILTIFPNASSAFSPGPAGILRNDRITSLVSATDRIMTDMDIMCVANAAELCSMYDECDIEEREAILNRFEEQTDVLSERLAMMQILTKHLKTGERPNVIEEITNLKRDILDLVEKIDSSEKKYTSEEILGGSSVLELKDEIMNAIQDETQADELTAKDEFLNAMLEGTNNGKNYEAWLGF
jgi:hypothetical protein